MAKVGYRASEDEAAFLSDVDESGDWSLNQWIDYFQADVPEDEPPPLAAEMKKFLAKDKEGDMIFMFPRSPAMDVDVDIDDPLAQARKIFVRPVNSNRLNTYDNGFPELQGVGSVTAQVYHDVCRKKFVEVLRASGIALESFDSVDKDVVFLKAWLPVNGKTIKSLAERFCMNMPFLESSQVTIHKNDHGDPVPAYVEYSTDYAEHLRPFSKIQAINLLRRHVAEEVCLQEMFQQGVVADWFCSGSFEERKELSDTLCSVWKLLCPPTSEEIQLARNYLGEKFAFYIFWVSQTHKGICVLAVPATIVWYLRVHVYLTGHPLLLERIYGNGFLIIMLIGITMHCAAFKSQCTRLAQLWGTRCPLKRARQPLRFSTRLTVRSRAIARNAANGVTFGYLIFAVGIITFSWMAFRHVSVPSVRVIPPAIVSLVLRICWQRIASILTWREDHRNDVAWCDAYTAKVCLVQLPVTICPAFYIAYSMRFTELVCGDSLNHVCEIIRGAGAADLLPFLNATLALREQAPPIYDQYCVSGCYPTNCRKLDGHYSTLQCESNCVESLHWYLWAWLLTWVIEQLVHNLPWFSQRLTGYNASRELSATPAEATPSIDRMANNPHYTGEQYCLDFIEFITLFGMMACFGAVLPEFVLASSFAFIILFKAKMYILINIMHRPHPTGTDSIEIFEYVIVLTGTLAVMSNVGLFCFMLSPMRDLAWPYEALALVILEHVMLLLHLSIYALFPMDPGDVDAIDGLNEHFIQRMKKQGAQGFYRPDAVQDTSAFDVGLYSTSPEGIVRRNQLKESLENELDE
jgi:hypothetical protein